MPNWYYDKSDLKRTPSHMDSLDYETEQRYRREGARFIINVGTTMGLRYDTMATGVVYFHRFYMFHSFRTFPRYVTACCCLFLAGKVEETPKKCKDIIKTARNLLTDKYFAQFGEDPKEEVMTLERILLQTIKFDLQVDHPYSYLLKYAKALRGEKTKVQKLVQMAWTFVNDSLCTTLCLQWEPEIIAIALMYLASKLSKFEIMDWVGRTSKQNRWWDMFVEDMSVELLEDICHQVLDLYSTPISSTPKDSPPPSPPPRVSSVKGRPPTPLPTARPASPIMTEPIAPASVTAAPVPQVIAPIPVVPAVPVVVVGTPLPSTSSNTAAAAVAARNPTATPVAIVGHPIPCLEEGVAKPPLPPPPPSKNVLPIPETHPSAKMSSQPPLVSPIQSLANPKFSYPQSSSTPTTPKPPQLAAKDESYPYVPPPPLPPPPGPPFQQPVFRESPKEPFGGNVSGFHQPAQYYAGSEPSQKPFYAPQEEKKQFYSSGGSGNFPPSHSGRPYPDMYSSVPLGPGTAGLPSLPPSGHAPPSHGLPGHAPAVHAPPGHAPPGHPVPPPTHVPPGHVPPGHIPGHPATAPGHLPPVHGQPSSIPPIQGPPVGPYEDKNRPYISGSPFPPGQHYVTEPVTGTHAAATGIPTVRITGRY